MSKAVGGYVRRCERRPSGATAPEPDAPRCSYCHARTDIGMYPHICKEYTYGTALMPGRTIPLGDDDGAGGP